MPEPNETKNDVTQSLETAMLDGAPKVEEETKGDETEVLQKEKDELQKQVDGLKKDIDGKQSLTSTELADALRVMRAQAPPEAPEAVAWNEMDQEEFAKNILVKIQEQISSVKTDVVGSSKKELELVKQQMVDEQKAKLSFEEQIEETVLGFVPSAKSYVSKIKKVLESNPTLAHHVGAWNVYAMLVGQELLTKLQKNGKGPKEPGGIPPNKIDVDSSLLITVPDGEDDASVIAAAIEEARAKRGIK